MANNFYRPASFPVSHHYLAVLPFCPSFLLWLLLRHACPPAYPLSHTPAPPLPHYLCSQPFWHFRFSRCSFLADLQNVSIPALLLPVRSEDAALLLLHTFFPSTRMPSGAYSEPQCGAADPTPSSISATSAVSILLLLRRLSFHRPARRPLFGARAPPTPLKAPALIFFPSCGLLVAQLSPAPMLLFAMFGGMVKRVHSDLPAVPHIPRMGFSAKARMSVF